VAQLLGGLQSKNKAMEEGYLEGITGNSPLLPQISQEKTLLFTERRYVQEIGALV